MLKNTSKVAIFGAIVAAAALAVFLSASQHFQSNGSTTTAGADAASSALPTNTGADDAAFDALIEEKQRTANAAVLADPRVAQFTDVAFNVNQDFIPKELSGKETDEVNMRVVAKQTVTGDWQTSQERTYSGVVDIMVSLDEGSLVNVEVTQVPDRKETVVFTEDEKAIINAVMQNDSIKAFLAGHDDVYVFTVYLGTYLENPDYNCPPGSCAVVTMAQENTKNTLHAWVNTSTNQVSNIAGGRGW